MARAYVAVPLMRGSWTKGDSDMSKTAVLRLVETPVPSAVSETSPRKGVTNEDRRPREHLSRDEVMVLVKAARANRNGARDAAAIWIAFNQGLRVSEL